MRLGVLGSLIAILLISMLDIVSLDFFFYQCRRARNQKEDDVKLVPVAELLLSSIALGFPVDIHVASVNIWIAFLQN